jgi:LysR family transcriptional regulator, glycine cleavage system transcriptional activator
MRYLPSLPAVRVFEAAARHENFTRAARELGLTQAGVSYQIRLLEDQLGTRLFDRINKRVKLSGTGAKLARRLEAAFDAMADAFGDLAKENDATLTISATQTVATWLAPFLGGFQLAHPNVGLRIETGSTMTDFARENVDLALRIGRGPWPGLKSHLLFDLHCTPICSPGYRDQHDFQSPQDLLTARRLSPNDDWWAQWFAQMGVEQSRGPISSGVHFDSQIAESRAALNGGGIAILAPFFWQQELASGELVRIFPDLDLNVGGLWLVYPEHVRNRPKIAFFRRWLLDHVHALRSRAVAVAGIPPEPGSDKAEPMPRFGKA